MTDSSVVTLRLPQSLVDRADALIESIAHDEEAALLGRVSRSIVLRLAILRGLEQLEAQRRNNSGPATKNAPKPRRKRA